MTLGLYSTRNEVNEKCPYRIHNKGTQDEYRENYYYVLEAKPVLHRGVVVNLMTEFVENVDMSETGKQDCERKACRRLMERKCVLVQTACTHVKNSLKNMPETTGGIYCVLRKGAFG